MGTRLRINNFIRVAKQQLLQIVDSITTLLLRERRIQLVVVIVVSIASGTLAYSVNSSAASERERWTSRYAVLVTATNISRGDVLTTSNTRVVQLPVATIADDALMSIPRGARARLTVAPNTPLTHSLIDDQDSTLSIPDGWRGVALPSDAIAPMVSVGDQVDVISHNDVISQNALVVELSDTRGITIAVPAADAPVVASAAQSGDVSLVVLNH